MAAVAHVEPPPRRRAAGAALLLAGAVMIAVGLTGWSGAPGSARTAWAAGSLDEFGWFGLPVTPSPLDLGARWAVPTGPIHRTSTGVATPIRVRIPAIDVRAPLDPLGLNDDGALEVPEDFARTGWWKGGPEPGEEGPAVIVGHVDSHTGPAVFFRLHELRSGDLVHVDRADGTTGTFAVRSTMSVHKDRFPTAAVYGPTDGPELRLITCHGDFHGGSYDHNLVLFARPA